MQQSPETVRAKTDRSPRILCSARLGTWLAGAMLLLIAPGASDAAERDAQGEAATSPPVEAAGQTEAGNAAGAVSERPLTRAELEQAVREAEAAADEAWIAARAARGEEGRPESGGTRRTGPYLGAAFLYAAEEFEDSIIVKSSLGGAVFAGYRFRGIFAADVRFDGFEGFDLKGSAGRAEVSGYAVTVNAKIYPFSGPIEPFAGVGVGGMRLKAKTVFNSGLRARGSESDTVIRLFGGLDLPLTEHLALSFEAAYLVPVDELDGFEMTTLSGGLTFFF